MKMAHRKTGTSFMSALMPSTHPWEDWAETWAHYLHMMDTLETAYYAGLIVRSNRQRYA